MDKRLYCAFAEKERISLSQRMDAVLLDWKRQLVKTIVKTLQTSFFFFFKESNYVLDFVRGLKIHLLQIATKIVGHIYLKFHLHLMD